MPGFSYPGAFYPGAELTTEAPPGPGVPVNVHPPEIIASTPPEEGESVTAFQKAGSWTESPTGYEYQWYRCDNEGNSCSAIPSATSNKYTLTAADVGHTIRLQIVAKNALGPSEPAISEEATEPVGGEAPPPPPPPPVPSGEEGEVAPISIRARPPTALIVSVETPDGFVQRWGEDDRNPIFSPTQMTFGSAMPGGFDRFSCVLQRNPLRNYRDLAELSTITVRGIGGTVAWQGRLEKLPDTAGFQSQVTPEAVGYQAALEDDQGVSEIYVDRELGKWTAATLPRRLQLLPSENVTDPSVGPGPDLPAVIIGFPASWVRPIECEAMYDAKGIDIGKLIYTWKLKATNTIGDDPNVASDPNFTWKAYLSTDDVFNSYDQTLDLKAAGPSLSGELKALAGGGRRWAMIQLFHKAEGLPPGTPHGTDGVTYEMYWPVLAIYGTHGIPSHGLINETDAPGLFDSEIVAHAVGKWTNLAVSIGDPTFIVPHLAFLEPTTVAEIVKQATRFTLADWAVWEGPTGPTFYMNERGKGPAKKWRARVGPAQLQEAGPQASRLWNGVVVQYQDVTGAARSVGPEQNSYLLDPDPENPANKTAIKKWASLRMGTSTEAAAIQIGRIFLAEQKAHSTAGQASIVGHVEDLSGTFWPSWMIRAGDEIAFLDASDTSYRRIVSVNYDHPSRTNTLQLDQPPEGMQALLERLSVVLVPLGVS